MHSLKTLEESLKSKFPEKRFVLGSGNVNSKIMLIGEAPGANEEEQGKPFVGKAGKNLDEFLEYACIKRDELYITNVVKLRPTKISPKTGGLLNRTPSENEIKEFLPLLMLEIKEINPSLVVTLGNVPLRAVLGDKKAEIGAFHGKLIEKDGIRLFPLYHPAAVIYNPSLKEIYISDVKAIRKII